MRTASLLSSSLLSAGPPPPPVCAGAVHEAAPDADTVVVGVLPGPHANPDYFTDDAVDVFYSSPYQVHYNSNR
jgi:urea carboxylase